MGCVRGEHKQISTILILRSSSAVQKSWTFFWSPWGELKLVRFVCNGSKVIPVMCDSHGEMLDKGE